MRLSHVALTVNINHRLDMSLSSRYDCGMHINQINKIAALVIRAYDLSSESTTDDIKWAVNVFLIGATVTEKDQQRIETRIMLTFDK